MQKFKFLSISEIKAIVAESERVQTARPGLILHVTKIVEDWYDIDVDDERNGTLKAVVIQLEGELPEEWDYNFQICDEDENEPGYPKQFWQDVKNKIPSLSNEFIYNGEYTCNEQSGGGGIHLEDLNAFHFMVVH